MLPDWVSNPGPLTYESGVLPIALRGPACFRATPQSPQTAHEGGEPPHPFPTCRFAS